MRKLAIAIVVFWVVTSPVQAFPLGWPSYRHDHSHSGASDIPLSPPLVQSWSYQVGGELSTEAVTSGPRVYVGSKKLYCFDKDRETDNLLWSLDVPSEITTTPFTTFDTVIFASQDGFVTAIDAEVRSQRWKMQIGKVQKGIGSYKESCIFGNEKGDLLSVDIKTGQINFKVNILCPISVPPCIADDKIFVCCDAGKLYCLNASNGAFIWKSDVTTSDVIGGMLYHEGAIYFGSYDNRVYAVSASDGKTIWSKKVDGWIGAHPVAVGNEIFVRSKLSTLWCFDSKSGETIWHFPHEPTKTEPVVSGDYIYIGSNRRIVAFSVSKRIETWYFEFAKEQPTSLSISGDKLLVGTNGGRIYCLKAGPGFELSSDKIDLEVMTTDERPSFELSVKNNREDRWPSMLIGDVTTDYPWMVLEDKVFKLRTGESKKFIINIKLDELNKVGVHDGKLYVRYLYGVNEAVPGEEPETVIIVPVTLKYIDPFPPKVCIEGESIDAGAVTLGQTKKVNFAIRNCGKGKLVFSLDAQSLEGWLRIIDNQPTFSLMPEETKIITAEVAAYGFIIEPGDDCQKTGVIEIQSNTEQSVIPLTVTCRVYDMVLPTVVSIPVGLNKASINGKKVDVVPPSYVSRSRTMVPLRIIAEAFFARVSWDSSDKSITITNCTSQSRFTVGSKKVEIIGMGEVKTTTIDSPPEIRSGKTFIPLRAVSDILGASVAWEQKTKTATITYNP